MNNSENTRDMVLIDTLLCKVEDECLEFKGNNIDPRIVGKLCSALSNSARIYDKNYAYVLWGVNDDGVIVGTDFNPDLSDNKDILKFKLAQKLKPSLDCDFRVVQHPKGRIVILEIPATTLSPVEFDGTAYVRIGSATPKLSDHSNKMQTLIGKLQVYVWEKEVAKSFLTSLKVLELLNYEVYFKLTDQSLPQSEVEILKYFEAEGIVEKDIGNKWNILNLGALLLAKDLNDFSTSLARKGVRFTVYNGNNKSETITNRLEGAKGYAMALEGLVKYINEILRKSEVIGEVFREVKTSFPQIAIREIVANALIHQDMTITGAGPQVELFNNRLVVSNPGEPLNPVDRMIDLPPRSRNEKLAGIMRRMGLCEEQGSGMDKVIYSVEAAQLPAPQFITSHHSTQIILYSYRPFSDLTTDERMRACYQHAVIKYIVGEGRLKNSSLCVRFGIAKGNESQATKVIKSALSKKLIKIADTESPRSGYWPFWA
ncbi:ATP-binding protein [Bathymodiolus thermophilus thioautotrophic gill symbiont]|uniref:Transcriptional regulator n=1 Tax=Bathymodiolus thermophilus thioautotrophic gill symbiont TaxID=2360 RepID=A0A1J5TXA3_9GAMM|nr:ATP-binding protein [Bathymodiolus thermophilus thioautotrophic gill symbiont]OIR24844.1 transcriptional regulator [Bathymodiolus thermophilus thioautotrophic gill symbiont]